ncbi:hypothetical protein GCM10027422_47490 [Hymenobacter arcticus]
MWLPLDETTGQQALDLAGQQRNGTLSGGGSWQPTGGHDGGGALALVAGERLQVPVPFSPTAYTLSFWLKPTRRFDWSQATGAGWGMFLFHSTHDGSIYVGTSGYSRIEYLVPNTVEQGVWQHFVFSFDNGVGTLYKNGRLLRQQGGMTIAPAWQGLTLGASGDELYDEVRVYDRAVSGQEAHDLYQCPLATSCSMPPIQVTPSTFLTTGQSATLQARSAITPAALIFDGGSNGLVINQPGTTTPALLTDVVNTFTVEAWVNPTATHEVDQQSTGGTAGVNGQRYLIFPENGGNWGAEHAGMGISVGTNGVSVYEHAGGYMPPLLVWEGILTGWTHVAVVYTDRRPTLYINGQLKAQGEQSLQTYVHPSLGLAGGYYGYYQGQVDELRIWSEARTPAQLQATYQQALVVMPATLVGCWHFDEGTGLTTADAGGRQLTATLWDPTSPWLTTAVAPIAPALTYSWSPALGLTQTTGTTVVATPAATTTYTVTATGGAGCATSQATVTLTVLPCSAPPIQVSPTTTTVGAGQPTLLQAHETTTPAALQFDGVADQVLIPTPGSPRAHLFEEVNTFTVEAWVNPTATHEVDQQSTGGTAGVNGQRYLIFPENGGNWGAGHAGMGISVGTNGVSVYEHAGGYMPPLLVWEGTLTGWTHVAVVYTDRRPTLYINGQLKAQGEQSLQTYVHPSLYLGGGAYGYYQGQVDELRIWNEARTPAQLQATYQQALAIIPATLVGCWHFDEGTGLTTADAGGRQLTATLGRGQVSSAGYSVPAGSGPQWQVPTTAPLIPTLTYAWSPAVGLDRTTGSRVIATPATTTVYTVTATSDATCTASQASTTLTVTGTITTLPPDKPSDDLNRNWTLERSFDGNGNEVAASKQFTDGLGRPTQAQARNAATQQVFAAQTLYNTGGQPVLQTLAAPTNNQSFNYKEGFITATVNGQSAPYNPSNFEEGNANAPTPVEASTIGTLGYYYSKLNEQESLTPITSYPYSLVELYEGPMGGTRRAAAPGDEWRMGKGREGKSRDFPVRKEFDAYVRLRPYYVPGSPDVTLEYQAIKSVSLDADGRESIVVSNKDGQALISCLSGPQYAGLDVYGFISSEASNPFDSNAPAYQDVHIPAAGRQDVKFTMGAFATAGGRVLIRNLITDDTTSYAIHAATPGAEPERHVTLEPGFYRFTSVTGTQWSYYQAHYGNFSYTYYDDAGRVVATVAPNGLPAGNSSSPVNSADGAVGHWPLSEGSGTTAGDNSGNTFTGTLQSQPVWSTNSPPTGKGSLVFDGRASYVLVKDQPALRMSTTMSMEAWIYPTGNTTGIIVNKENEYEMARFPDGSIQWAFQNASPGWYWINTGIVAPLNQWSRISITYDNGTVRAYLNGAQVGPAYAGAGAIVYQGSDLRIGDRLYGPQVFEGAIAEVRLWNTVHPPGSSAGAGGTGGTLTQPAFTTRNTYDTSGRLLATESNDEGRSEYVYARDGRIRFSQSALQRPAGRFSYSNYDEAGRVVESGEYTSTLSSASQATVFENHLTTTPGASSTLQPALLEDRTATGGLDVARCAQRNQVWYDLAFDGTAGSQGSDSQLNGRTQEFGIGAVTKTRNDNVTTWYSYDELGRVTWVVQDIIGVGVKTLDYQYDFSGNVLQVAYQKGQADSFYHYYGYDAAQRLTTVYTSPNGTTQTLQAQYSYYLHGPLKRVQVAGNLQGIDYTYTLQGALKSINHATSALEPGHDAPTTNGTYKDLFALTLEYFSGDYRSRNLDVTAPVLPGASGTTRYDGTIQAAAWRTGSSADIQRMAYTYDEKSQLQNSAYSNWQLKGSTHQLNAALNTAFQEGGMSYDANGNMLSLRRTNQTGAVTDDFTYTYKTNTNQLKEVHNGGAVGATLDYDYDEVGQMTRQRDEQGQRYFAYDVRGKATGIYADAAPNQPLVTFAYDDRGFRVSKTAYASGVAIQTTYYVRDVAGNILAVYNQPAPAAAVQRAEVPLYGASRLGSLTHLDDGTAPGLDDYRYELNDHLGDARVVFHRPTTEVTVETMELAGVPAKAAFLNDDRYRVAVSGAPSGDYVARLTDSQPAGQELKRVLAVTRGDTLTFSALAQWKQNAAAGGSGATPFVLLGAAAGVNALSQRGAEGQPTTYATNTPNWLSLLAAGLGFTFGQSAPASLGATSLEGWIKYRVLDARGNPMLDAQGQPLAGVDYLLGTGKWEYLQTGVRVPQDGTIEVTAGTSGTGEAVYFDNLRVEQTGGLIVQEQHQYAFGAPLPGLSYTVGNKRYRYGYQGQFAEHDDETGFESFELRLYNSRIGRWLSYDPEGQFNSPYVGMGNNPVSGVDPDGGWSGPGPRAGQYVYKTIKTTAVAGVARSGSLVGTASRLGSSLLRSASSALDASDTWMHDGRGERFGQHFANLHPWIQLMNIISSYKSGDDIYGNQMSEGQAQEAMSGLLFPVPEGGMRGGSVIGEAGGLSVGAIQLEKGALLSVAKDQRLRNIIGELWRDGATTGNGSAMDAVRNELRTGLPTRGKFHSMKIKNLENGLNSSLNRKGGPAAQLPLLSPQDAQIARYLLNDIHYALHGL